MYMHEGSILLLVLKLSLLYFHYYNFNACHCVFQTRICIINYSHSWYLNKCHSLRMCCSMMRNNTFNSFNVMTCTKGTELIVFGTLFVVSRNEWQLNAFCRYYLTTYWTISAGLCAVEEQIRMLLSSSSRS